MDAIFFSTRAVFVVTKLQTRRWLGVPKIFTISTYLNYTSVEFFC